MSIHDKPPLVWSIGHYDYKLVFADLLPPLPDDELAELEADIAAHGIAVPVLVTDDDVVVDGYHRLAIARKLGIESVPRRTLGQLTLDQARDRAIATNVHRRQLTRDERRALIAKLLIATPDKSDRVIADAVSASDKTVAAVRGD
jgi:ParB-like chromosome segregation protein Spo0J